MSGGSFNYLCMSSPAELLDKKEDLKKMSEELLPIAAHSHLETEKVIKEIEKFEKSMQKRIDKLYPVWRAMEWWRSGDIGQEQFVKVVQKWNAENVK